MNRITVALGVGFVACLFGASCSKQPAPVSPQPSSAGGIEKPVTASVPGLASRTLPAKPVHTKLGPGDDPRHINVKFLDDLDVELGSSGYPADLSGKNLNSQEVTELMNTIAQAGGRWTHNPGTSKDRLASMRAEAEKNLGYKIANMYNNFTLAVPTTVSSEGWIDKLNLLVEVELASPFPMPVPPP